MSTYEYYCKDCDYNFEPMSETFTKEKLDYYLSLSKEELREKGIEITYTYLYPEGTEDIVIEEDSEIEQRIMSEFEKIL